MGLEVGGGGTEEEEKKEERGKIPLCESVDYWPLWGHCPAPLSTLSITYLGRARVPLTILRFCDYLFYGNIGRRRVPDDVDSTSKWRHADAA